MKLVDTDLRRAQIDPEFFKELLRKAKESKKRAQVRKPRPSLNRTR